LSAGHILVVALNPDFRSSLAFALETEGYSVETRGDLVSVDHIERFRAIVLDHKAFRQEPPDGTSEVRNALVPVILLASKPNDWLTKMAFRTVPTPIMGTDLSDAVADAMAMPQGTQRP
jgi:DNA-binding response OmpR family regulator